MILILILIIIVILILIIAPAWMYITQVLFKRVFILLEFFCCDRLGLTVDFKRSFSEFPACKFPSSVWHEHVRNCKKKYNVILEQKCVGGLNLHSFAPVRKEQCKIILMIAIMGYIL